MSNNSGINSVNYNNLERALSTDQNLESQLPNKAIVELWRQAAITRHFVSGFENGASGVGRGGDDQGDTVNVATPLRATVLGGFDFLVEGATITVNPGVMVALNPEAVPDPNDSPAVYCQSSTGVVLAFAANAGNARWDLIEVRPVFAVQTTASRDIYDENTRTFSSQVVDKITGNVLEFRLRQGTPASPSGGPPAFEAGWLPIGAVFHSGATVSFDDCEVFDVRPLLSEMIDPTSSQDLVIDQALEIRVDGAESTSILRGKASVVGTPLEGTTVAGSAWQAGYKSSLNALFWRGTAASTTTPDLKVPAFGDPSPFGETGATIQADQYYRVSLVFPFGLPRWVRYSDAAVPLSRRSPFGGHGIPVLFGTGGYGADFGPLPAYYNTSGAFPAVAVAIVKTPGTIGAGTGTFLPVHIVNGSHQFPTNVGTENRFVNGVAGGSDVEFTLPRNNIQLPPNCNVVELNAGMVITFNPGIGQSESVNAGVRPTGGDQQALYPIQRDQCPPGTRYERNFNLPVGAVDTGSASPLDVTLNNPGGTAVGVVNTATLNVDGFKVIP